MLRHSRFDSEEIDREKGVIIEEMNMYFDTPRDYVSGVFDDLMYGDHPLGWDILGRKETVQGATRETFSRNRPLVHGAEDGGRRRRSRRARAGGEALELLGDLPDGGGGAPEPAARRSTGVA